MPRKVAKVKIDPEVVEAAVEVAKKVEPSVGVDALAAALVQAINSTKAPEKKNAYNRKKGDPWQPKDGSPKLKLKRKMFQHSLPLDAEILTNEQIELLNNLKPGRYCDGWIKVYRRRDRGIDIDYPVKTAAQRLKLSSAFGITSFDVLLTRCIHESNNPSQYKQPDDLD